MTTIALDVPRRLLTAADYAALPEWTDQHWELLEGNLVMTAYASLAHQVAEYALTTMLKAAAPPELFAIHQIETDLQLAPADEPGTVRRPDIVVLTEAGRERVTREPGLVHADEVLLAIEIVSPGSRRTDRIIKLGEYADAGIPNYWIVDLDDGPSLVANRLVDGRYEAAEPVRGQWRAEAPFPVTIDLSALS